MTAFDDAYINQLRNEDAAALDAFRACHRLTEVERERAMAWTAANRKDRIRPLYRVAATPQRIVVTSCRDEDDEPWGDPVGLGMPRPRRRHPLATLLIHALTAKYRRVL